MTLWGGAVRNRLQQVAIGERARAVNGAITWGGCGMSTCQAARERQREKERERRSDHRPDGMTPSKKNVYEENIELCCWVTIYLTAASWLAHLAPGT